MKAVLRKLLLIIMEEVAIRLIGTALFVTWMLAVGVTAGCVSLYEPKLNMFYLTIAVAAVLAMPVVALWVRLRKTVLNKPAGS